MTGFRRLVGAHDPRGLRLEPRASSSSRRPTARASPATSSARRAPSASCRSCSTPRATRRSCWCRSTDRRTSAPSSRCPAGMRDVDGEDTAEVARRELIEEAGLQAGDLDTAHRDPAVARHDRFGHHALPGHRLHPGAPRPPGPRRGAHGAAPPAARRCAGDGRARRDRRRQVGGGAAARRRACCVDIRSARAE